MTNNLIPPFIMREAGITVNGTTKIHTENSSEMDHSLYFMEAEVRITLSLSMAYFRIFIQENLVSNIYQMSSRSYTLLQMY